MAGKALAVFGILVGIILAAQGGRLAEEEDTMSAWNVLDATEPLSSAAATATATVSVVLIRQRNVHVYGQIFARIGNSNQEIVLFRRTRSQAILVRPGFVIPLTTSVVRPVPLNCRAPSPDCYLTIRADLMERENPPNNDNELARGQTRMPSRSSGTSSESLPYAPFGTIVVEVAWRSP